MRRPHRPATDPTAILHPCMAALRLGRRLPRFLPHRRGHSLRPGLRLGLRGLREHLLDLLLLRRRRRWVASLRPPPRESLPRRARRVVALLAHAAAHCLPCPLCLLAELVGDHFPRAGAGVGGEREEG
uniref:Uncharacterized protein n=1 Tax=Arundo donax TaxID=35708 RepID=A0A0A9FVZ0_ARUDO